MDYIFPTNNLKSVLLHSNLFYFIQTQVFKQKVLQNVSLYVVNSNSSDFTLLNSNNGFIQKLTLKLN